MRRVSVANAAAGMVLCRPVYDSKGYPLIGAGEALTDGNLSLLTRTAGAELLVDDPRTQDIFVKSVFEPELEAKAVQSLGALLTALPPGPATVQPASLVGVAHTVKKMLDAVFPYVVGDVEVAGAHALGGRDAVHGVKVAEMALVVGRMAGLEHDDLHALAMAAMLMNAGHRSLPGGLLDQPRPLLPEEVERLRTHPRLSLEALAASGLPRDAFLAIAQHHERWDGSGYPAGRRGDEISTLARILAIADAYVALLSERPHRHAMPAHDAIEFVLAYSGELFDPALVQIVARQLPQYPTGITVILSTGETGVVSNANTGHVGSPVVRVCAKAGAIVRAPYEMDLTDPKNQHSLVVQVDL